MKYSEHYKFNLPQESDIVSIEALTQNFETIDTTLKNHDDLILQLVAMGDFTEIKSWESVQRIVRMGLASKIFTVGDRLECQRNGQTLVWDIIGIDHDLPFDKKYTHSLTLQLRNVLQDTLREFDAAEPTNPDSEVASAGSNDWKTSNIRKWLNSNKAANDWFNPQTEYDTAPSYASEDGFMRGFDEDFLNVLGKVVKTTSCNNFEENEVDYTADIFFLLSASEVYATVDTKADEGSAYEYYRLSSSNSSSQATADTGRIRYLNGQPLDWYLRTPNINNTRTMRPVGTDGSIAYKNAIIQLGISPACCVV